LGTLHEPERRTPSRHGVTQVGRPVRRDVGARPRPRPSRPLAARRAGAAPEGAAPRRPWRWPGDRQHDQQHRHADAVHLLVSTPARRLRVAPAVPVTARNTGRTHHSVGDPEQEHRAKTAARSAPLEIRRRHAHLELQYHHRHTERGKSPRSACAPSRRGASRSCCARRRGGAAWP
jgi:hypothetical protein